MITYFDIDTINELVVKAHAYISEIGLRIIDDKNSKGDSNLEDFFFSFLDLLEVIELRKDLETTDDRFQELVLRLYSQVNNQCVYYDEDYIDLDDPMFSGSITVGTGAYVKLAGDAQTITSPITFSNPITIPDATSAHEAVTLEQLQAAIPPSGNYIDNQDDLPQTANYYITGSGTFGDLANAYTQISPSGTILEYDNNNIFSFSNGTFIGTMQSLDNTQSGHFGITLNSLSYQGQSPSSSSLYSLIIADNGFSATANAADNNNNYNIDVTSSSTGISGKNNASSYNLELTANSLGIVGTAYNLTITPTVLSFTSSLDGGVTNNNGFSATDNQLYDTNNVPYLKQGDIIVNSFSNGLTDDGLGNITLGGVLSSDTIIDTQGLYYLHIGNINGVGPSLFLDTSGTGSFGLAAGDGNAYVEIHGSGSQFMVATQEEDQTDGSNFKVSYSEIKLECYSNSYSLNIDINPLYGVTIEDNIVGIGASYAQDYSTLGQYNYLWIPNWGFLQTQFPMIDSCVPYTGATGNVDLGSNSIVAQQVNASNPTGIALSSVTSGTGSSIAKVVMESTYQSGTDGFAQVGFNTDNNTHSLLLRYFPSDNGGPVSSTNRLEVFNTGITEGQTVNGGQIIPYMSDLSDFSSGSGTTNYLTKWTGTNTQGNSLASDDGHTFSITTDAGTGINVNNTGGSTYFYASSTNSNHASIGAIDGVAEIGKALAINEVGSFTGIGGYTADPTSGNVLGVDGNSYYSGTITSTGGLNSFTDGGGRGLQIGNYTNTGSAGAIYAYGLIPSISNYSFATDGASTYLNAPSSNVQFLIGNSLIGVINSTGISVTGTGIFTGSVTANSFIKSGGTSSQFLKADGSVDTSIYITNPMTSLGDVIYGGISGIQTRLAGNITTSKMFLTSTGNGTISSVPVYFDLFGTANTWTASQSLQGIPTAPTAAVSTNTTQIATTAFVANSFITNNNTILANIAGINGTSSASTLVYTNSTGKTVYITQAAVGCSSQTGATVGPQIDIYSTANGSIYSATVASALITTSTVFWFNSNGMSVVIPNGDTVYFRVDTAATATSMTLNLTLLGFAK